VGGGERRSLRISRVGDRGRRWGKWWDVRVNLLAGSASAPLNADARQCPLFLAVYELEFKLKY